jgi:hypothetical protein
MERSFPYYFSTIILVIVICSCVIAILVEFYCMEDEIDEAANIEGGYHQGHGIVLMT